MPPKKTRKTAPSTQSDFSKSIGAKKIRETNFQAMQNIIKNNTILLLKFINSHFIIKSFNDKRYITGLTDSAEASRKNSTADVSNLQLFEIQLVTMVFVYFSHILVALSKISLPFKDDELEFIIESLEFFYEISNLYFLKPLPSGLNKSITSGLTSALDMVFDLSRLNVSGLDPVDIQSLQWCDNQLLRILLIEVIDSYYIKRAELLTEKDAAENARIMRETQEQAEKEAAIKRAADAEAELLASLSVTKKSNKTKKNTKCDNSVIAPSVSVPSAPLTKKAPIITEKELKKIEADEKNRQKQLEAKQRKLEEQQQRNAELMKKFTMPNESEPKPDVKKSPSPSAPPAVSPPIPHVAASPPIPHVAVSPSLVAVSPPPLVAVSPPPPIPPPVSAFAQEQPPKTPIHVSIINSILNKEEQQNIINFVKSNKANDFMKANYSKLKFTQPVDDSYVFLVNSTLYILSELTKAFGKPIFCLKGGKVLQLTQTTPYVSDDIDILILDGSHQVALDIKAFIKSALVGRQISILDKSTAKVGANQNLIKLSYGIHSLKAFLDIDFSPTPDYAKSFFSNLIYFNDGILNFYMQSMEDFLDEKIFFREVYKRKCKYVTEEHQQNICKYQYNKFDKVIKALNPPPQVFFEHLHQMENKITQSLDKINI